MLIAFFVFLTWSIFQIRPTFSQDICDEGTEIRRGQTWFVCRRGIFYPSACYFFDSASKSEHRIELGSTIWTSNSVMKCDQTGPNSASAVRTACIRNGNVLPIGQTVSDGLFWYLCKKDENSGLLLQLSGCVDQSGELIQPKGVLVRGNFVYTCIRDDKNQSVYLEPRGCSVGGQLYNLGDEVVANGFWYICNAKIDGTDAKITSEGNNAIALKTMGCYQDGQKLKDGDSFRMGDFVYKCDLSNPVSRTSAGCYARSSNGSFDQHPLGDRWLEGQPPVRIVMECKGRGRLSVSKGPVQCYYESGDREIEGRLAPGCARLFPNAVLVTCSIANGKDVDTQIVMKATQAHVQIFKQRGFKEC